MANLNKLPDRLNVNLTYTGQTSSAQMPSFKLVPKNPDGSIFDCTGYNVATFIIALPTLANPLLSDGATLTIGLADATGIVIAPTQAEATNLAASMPGTRSSGSISITDGTNTVVAGLGQFLGTYNP
jgi:hypothetical protein